MRAAGATRGGSGPLDGGPGSGRLGVMSPHDSRTDTPTPPGATPGPDVSADAPPLPVVGMLHQPPGGIDHRPPRSLLQATLDRLAYRRAQRLLVASDSLADELRHAGEPARRIRVVPPGRDVATSVGEPPGDLRQGRRVAFLCVGNWVARKGIFPMIKGGAAQIDVTYVANVVTAVELALSTSSENNTGKRL